MSIDWSILHWVRDVLTCPFLDFLMPKGPVKIYAQNCLQAPAE